MTSSRLLISELFYSLQGESTRAGLPCTFIRLSGCNLRCRYCDSRYTWEESGRSMSVSDITAWLDNYPGVMVEVTGGEPLLQNGVYPLLDALTATGRVVLLETNGSLPVDRVPTGVHIILDLKCPDSGMSDAVAWKNIDLLQDRKQEGSRDEVKFVLSSERDYEWACRRMEQYNLPDLVPLLFSPVLERFRPERLAAMMLADRIRARLQLQLHRIIWPESERGV